MAAGSSSATQLDRPDRMAVAEDVEQLELERDEAQELPMPLRPESVGDGCAEEQLSAGTAGRECDVDRGEEDMWISAMLAKYGGLNLEEEQVMCEKRVKR